MTDQLKQSYIREFNQYKNELMSNVEENRGKLKKPFFLQVYGLMSVTEFSYNYLNNTGHIYKSGEKIQVI